MNTSPISKNCLFFIMFLVFSFLLLSSAHAIGKLSRLKHISTVDPNRFWWCFPLTTQSNQKVREHTAHTIPGSIFIEKSHLVDFHGGLWFHRSVVNYFCVGKTKEWKHMVRMKWNGSKCVIKICDEMCRSSIRFWIWHEVSISTDGNRKICTMHISVLDVVWVLNSIQLLTWSDFWPLFINLLREYCSFDYKTSDIDAHKNENYQV